MMTTASSTTLTAYRIQIDDLNGPEVAALLEEHLADMNATSPPESKHALDLEGLKHEAVTFWTLWHQSGVGESEQLAGCCAIKRLSSRHGEIKSMRTAAAFRRRGVARQLLQHLIREAQSQRLQQLSLETGSMEYFAAARALYSQFGFDVCEPFGDYSEDANSVFMTKYIE
jgi:putative acetyltransferase